MKKFKTILIFSYFISILFSNSGYAGGHDSLLFEGEYTFSEYPCVLEVIKSKGNTYGTRVIQKEASLCGKTEMITELKKGQLHNGDWVKAGDTISTGADGGLDLKFSDGKEVYVYPNSSFIVGSDYCKKNFIPVNLHYGMIAVDARRGSRDNELEVSTEKGKVFIKGTVFTFQTTAEEDILKVFEGSVTFQKNMQNKENINKAGDKGAEMKKLSEDSQAGKIGIEEFTKKMKELQEKVTETLESITVTAGFESRIIGTEMPTVPASFNTTENRWWKE